MMIFKLSLIEGKTILSTTSYKTINETLKKLIQLQIIL